MKHKVIKVETLFLGLLLTFITVVSNDAKVLADAGTNPYGLGLDDLPELPQGNRSLDFNKELGTELNRKSIAHKLEEDSSAFQIEVDYLDKTADVFSPHHSFNSEYDRRFNNTSREYETRMDYQLDYFTPNAVLKYSPDSYGKGRYFNYELGVAIPVKDIFSLETHYGWNQFNKKPEKGGMQDYQDWSIGVSANYRGVKLKLDYIDINASEDSEECSQLAACEGKTVFSIIKNF